MRTIWKYAVPILDRFTLALPQGAEYLSVQVQTDVYGNALAMLWALVDSDRPKERVQFAVVGTGGPAPNPGEGELRYIGTFQLSGGTLVFHLFSINRAGVA